MALAELIAEVVEYTGEITTDPSRPEGTPVKRTDMRQMHRLGWQHRTDLRTGIERTYQDFLSELHHGTLRET